MYKYNDFGPKKDVLSEGDIVYIQPKRNKAKDLLTDAQLAIGIKPKEFKEASQLVKSIKEKYGDVTVSGHSKGGALALYSAKSNNLKSVTHNPYIGPGMKKGLKSYFKDSPESEVHVHVNDYIGSSAIDHVPKQNLIAYTHNTKKAHSLKTFNGKQGVRLSDKKQTNIREKIKNVGVAVGVAALGAGAGTLSKLKSK